MKSVKTACIALLAVLMVACSHPLEPRGKGDILSATGTRNCYLEDFRDGKKNCTENIVLGAYLETYYAVPRDGWEFDRWENYCTDGTTGDECRFSVSADSVKQSWGQVMPALVAVFTELPPPLPGKIDDDGNTGFKSARQIADSGIITDTVSSLNDADYFVFTAGDLANYSVTLEFSNPNLLLYWYKGDVNESLVGESRDAGVLQQQIGPKLQQKGQVFYLGVQAKPGSGNQSYRLTITKIPYSKPPHEGDLSLDDGLNHIVDYDITGELHISNGTSVDVTAGVINSLWADIIYELRVQGGKIRRLWAYLGSIEITGGSIDVLSSEATTSRVTGGHIGEFNNLASDWTISGGTFSGVVKVQGDGTGVFRISGGDFQGGFETNHIQSQNKNFEFYGDLNLSLISVNEDEYLYRIAGVLADGSPINQTITCINFDFGATPGSEPCDAVEIFP